MKTCLPILMAVPVFFMPAICLQPVWANIYSYTTSDGSVKLGNEPPDGPYSVLVREPAIETDHAVDGEQTFDISKKAFYDRMVDEVARTYGLESALLHAVISVESRYRPRAVSKKGALGLMQLMPATAKRYGVADPLDPLQNLHGGAKHLRYLLNKFNNNRNLALAAYNAGEGAVERFGNRIPPYRETTSYVPRVMGFYRRYQLKS